MREEPQAQPRRTALPSWLSGQTIALLSGMLALAAFCQTGFTGLRTEMNILRGEIDDVRTELKGEIDALRTELKGDIATLQTELKGDIATLRTELKGDVAILRIELKGDIADLRKELKGDVEGLRTELKGDTENLRSDLRGDIAGLRSDLRRLEDRTRAVEVAVVGINVRLDNLERSRSDAAVAEETPALPPGDAESAQRVAQDQ